jgi:sporulation protein YlmC with PRC-barrel domain
MAINQFESSRIAAGTLNPGAQRLTETSHTAPKESSAVSRDDARDGFADNSAEPNQPQRRVVRATKLAGVPVRNSADESLGKIHEIMLDTKTGRIAYIVLSCGGLLGIGDKLFAVPWSVLRLDQDEKEFILDIDRITLENAPGFDKDDWPDMANPGFAETIHRHYGKPAYWRQEFTDAGDYVGDNSQPNRSIEHEPVTTYPRDDRQ